MSEERKKRVYYNKNSQMKYNATHTKQYGLRLNLVNDADVIAKLDSVPSKIGYIKELIRADIMHNRPPVQPVPTSSENVKITKEDAYKMLGL